MPKPTHLTPEMDAVARETIAEDERQKLLPPEKGKSKVVTVTNHAKGPRSFAVTSEGSPQYALLHPGESAVLRLDEGYTNSRVHKAMIEAGDITVDEDDGDEDTDTEHGVTMAGRLGVMNNTLPAGESPQYMPAELAGTEANTHMPFVSAKVRRQNEQKMAAAAMAAENDKPADASAEPFSSDAKSKSAFKSKYE